MGKGNVCILCGKDRVLLKKWEEKVDTYQGNSVVSYETYVCPDPECQKRVEESFEEKRKITKEREAQAQKREDDRAASRARNILKANSKLKQI